MANPVYPKQVGQMLPAGAPIALTTAEDTVTFYTGYDAAVLGQTLGGTLQPGFRTKTVGRVINLIADAEWWIARESGAQSTKIKVAAGQVFPVELVQETQQYFVSATTTANLKMHVVG